MDRSEGWIGHSYCSLGLKPLGIWGHQAPSQGKELETIVGLFLGNVSAIWERALDQESRSLVPDLRVTLHLSHSQALASDWKGQNPWAARTKPAVCIIQFL